jgi:hypothetical protein
MFANPVPSLQDNIIYASPAALVRHGGLSLEQFQELGRRLFT